MFVKKVIKNWFDRLTYARLRDEKKQIRHLASEDVLDYVLTSSSDTQDRETNTKHWCIINKFSYQITYDVLNSF